MVDDFSVKYEGKENADLLYNILAESYEITTDWREGGIQWTYPGLGLPKARGPPVYTRLCPMHANKIQPQTTSKTATLTISACAPKLWTANTTCKTI